MDLLSDFLDGITNNEDYRAGFMAGLVAVLVLWLVWWRLLFPSWVQWLKIRKFFEPTKTPGKMPTEAGPSPAGMMLGFLLRIAVIVLVVAIVVLFLQRALQGS
jgi:hypothetical protein